MTGGRRQRAVRSRERVLDAIHEVSAAAGFDVTAERIAAHAGVSLSTVRRLLGDIPSLQQATRERVMSRILPLLAEPPTAGTREERLRAIVKRRRDVFEIVLQGMRVTPVGERGDAARRRADRKHLDPALRAQFLVAFPDELAGKPGVALERLLSTMLSLAAWEHLRTIRELPPKRCAELLERAALALFDQATRA